MGGGGGGGTRGDGGGHYLKAAVAVLIKFAMKKTNILPYFQRADKL